MASDGIEINKDNIRNLEDSVLEYLGMTRDDITDSIERWEIS